VRLRDQKGRPSVSSCMLWVSTLGTNVQAEWKARKQESCRQYIDSKTSSSEKTDKGRKRGVCAQGLEYVCVHACLCVCMS